MKKALLILLFTTTASIVYAQGEISLYVSTQNGKYTFYDGSQSKTTDKHEQGTVNLSHMGPIVVDVSPADISIGPNQTKNWQGKVYPDINNAPIPGTSANAEVIANYDVTFSRAQGAGAGGTVQSTYNCNGGGCHVHGDQNGVHEIVSKTGSQKLEFKVYSVKTSAPENFTSCLDKEFTIYAEAYPYGGSFKWTAGENITLTNGNNNQTVQFKSTALGNSTLTVEYTIQGVSYKHTVAVNCSKPVVTFNVPDEITAAVGKQFTINPTITPSGGQVSWEVSSGLQLNSGTHNFVAFVTPKQPGDQTVTCTVKACGDTIVKTIKVKVNPCMVTVPDSVKVLKGTSATITASGNMQGTFSWTAGNNVQIDGAANQPAVIIKGATAGEGWAEVEYTGTDCSDKKKVRVIVLEKPTLKIDIAYAPMATMCLKERRILTAKVDPQGGTFSWTLSSPSLKFYGPAGNMPTTVVEADKGGPCTVTCTYTVNGETVSETITTDVKAYSKVELTPSNTATEIAKGTKVTYTAKVYDHNGQVVNNPPALYWRVVYMPIGQEDNVGNWVSYDLQGTGSSQDYTWSFPQGNNPLQGKPPYKLKAWIQASEHCAYHSGSVHIKVTSQNGQN